MSIVTRQPQRQMKKFDISELEKYEEEGWLMSHKHKTLPLIIWNYTQFTQYEAKWDDITLNCRGLVTDTEGNIIAKGFKKFFNYEEKKTIIPENGNMCMVYDKLDGSYIQLFFYRGTWIINSKGSFYSDQVEWAKEVIETRYSDYKKLDPLFTYCFELIYPENRIVVDYEGKKDLILIGCFKKGIEDNIQFLKMERELGFNICKPTLSVFSYDKLKNCPNINREGFVVLFPNGERCKIKFEEYLRLHRIVTNTTSYDIWECLRSGGNFDEILDRVPDEFMKFVTETKEDLESKFRQELEGLNEEFWNIIDKKKYAEIFKKSSKKGLLFTRLNTYSDDLKESIWRNIKPEFKKPFSNEH